MVDTALAHVDRGQEGYDLPECTMVGIGWA